ncbi:unnamed protein product [Blepharisma stoltei]|uniref:ABC transporter domain-containing protein n=1 Tax=Blepharisma stoltei TaxID=1481888 RepID=A0AAU9KC47_9CILI|nr:unnamed protein product [Blepharisma stoltei]
MSIWQHYRALLYKNWILWKRRLCGSLCEFLFPVFLLIILAIIRDGVGFSKHSAKSYISPSAMTVSDDDKNYFSSSFDPPVKFTDNPKDLSENYYRNYYSKENVWNIAFVNEGRGSFANEIIRALKEKIGNLENPYKFTSYSSEQDLEDYIESSDYGENGTPKICFAIVFYSSSPYKIEYSFRFNVTESYQSGSQRLGDYINIFDFDSYSKATDKYLRKPMPSFQYNYFGSNFIHIMNYIDNYILKTYSNNTNPYIAAGFVPMYYDDYVSDDFISLISTMLPFFVVISYLVPVCRMVSLIVQEKEYKIKEMMMIMGLSNKAYWLSWVTYYFTVYTLIAIIGGLISISLFKYSNAGMLLLLFWLYGISCLTFSIFISTFFSKSRSAVMLGLMAFLVSYFISFAVTGSSRDQGSKTVASIFPNVALTLGCNVLAKLEDGQEGVQSSNTSTIVEHYSFGTCLAFLVVDSILFILLAIYLDIVWPTEWGVKKPWYFLCTKSFWCRNRYNKYEEDFNEDIKWPDNVEPETDLMQKQKENGQALIIRNFKKVFGNKTVVDDLSLDIYKGQIFALLGHNGAGKTTTISMMCGLIPTTYGDMRINNLFLSKDLSQIRRYLGVCPQHNVLFNDLTPEEHLYLFAVFKGMKDKNAISDQIKEKLSEVDLIGKKDRKSKFLSGGMKRRLSLAIALIADSPIVLLDEPTSGMDLTARRQMWDMLKNNKSSRIIILTTHYMEEADVLADRIAIMSQGKLRCLGSSLFLKKRYGVGYYLTIVKEVGVSSKSHTRKVTEFINSCIPNAVLMSNVHAEITFQIPTSSSSKFTTFFSRLDSSLRRLKLRSYGVSVTTLEEVFLRVARGDDQELKKKSKRKQIDEGVSLDIDFVLSRDRLQGSLFMMHLKALLRKRILLSKRDKKSLIYEIFIPIVLVFVGLALMMISSGFKTPEKHLLSTSLYDQPQSPLYYFQENATVNGNFASLIDSDFKNTANSLQWFDKYLFDHRAEPENYRMGSFYFNKMDTTNDQYEAIIFHNQSAPQATGVYYNNIANQIFANLGTSVTVTVYNYPLPYTKKVKDLANTGDGFIASIVFSLGFSFIPTGIVALIVRERETNVKHQHMISGVSRFSYWCANFTWDSLKHFIPAIICSLLVQLFQVKIYTSPSNNYGAIWILMIFYGIAIAPFTYFTSFFFKSYPTAQIMTILFNVVAGGIFPAVVMVLYIFDSTRGLGNFLRWLFRFIPSFCFGNGLMDIGSSSLYASLDGKSSKYDAFDINSAGGDILMYFLMIPIYMLLVYLQEYLETHPKILQRFWKSPEVEPSAFEIDADVEKEARIAISANPKDIPVNVKGIRKIFRIGLKEAFAAVEDVSFNVNHQECFAFLGVNGAGKTTTFKMLTGEIAPTQGEAFICGNSVTKDLDRARELIGYCPQFDAISDLLTSKEHLRLYCDIKGIPRDRREALVEEMVDQMDLRQYADQRSGTYSGGNKRKLSVAMALIGNPAVVFLDEPSAGMDPETRKKMWKVIGNIKSKNSSVILTTHSMEEAEALSDRMAIMVAGRLRCLGTATWIKSKYGDRYEFEAKVHVPSTFEMADKGKILDRVLKGAPLVKKDQVEECLSLLGLRSLYAEIQEKGAGSSLYQQLKNDEAVHRDVLVSWAIIEEMGDKIYYWLKSEFKKVEIMEHFSSLYKFKVAKEAQKSIGYFFSIVETNKERLRITEYALAQSSLEQIFNDFAKKGEAEQAGVMRRFQG